MLYAFVTNVKNKQFQSVNIVVASFVLYFLALLALAIYGKVSPYYLGKCGLILWLISFLYMAQGLCRLLQSSKPFAVCYVLMWGCIFVGAVSGIERRVNEKAPEVNPAPIMETLFPVYTQNLKTLKGHDWGFDFKSIKALLERNVPQEQRAAMLGNEYRGRWYDGMYNDIYDIYFWSLQDEQIDQKLNQSNYVLVDKSDVDLVTKSGTTFQDQIKNLQSKYRVIDENSQYYLYEAIAPL